MIIYTKILVSVTLPIRRLEKLLFWNIKMGDFRRRPKASFSYCEKIYLILLVLGGDVR